MERLKYTLDIQKVGEVCLVNLKRKNDPLSLSTTLAYPTALDRFYGNWQRAYKSFYSQSLRGKAQLSEAITLTEVDWRFKLAQAEAKLLTEFHAWLQCQELYEIRAEIAQVSRRAGPDAEFDFVDVFITTNSPTLDALPWETWEIAKEGGVQNAIRIIRAPKQIRHAPVSPRAGKPRILVIAGDDTGLELTSDLQSSRQQLKGKAELTSLGWKISSQEVAELKQQLLDALADEQGWDAILFFGHSDGSSTLGGELALAPNSWIGIKEIEHHLVEAKQRGLQFALFNSCDGLQIAETLINLGLSQVLVMREPIHNRVAQQFLVDFLKGLAQHQDVYEAMSGAVRSLKADHNLSYPSAFLIPSLFCHPQADLFWVSPKNWKTTVKKLLPSVPEVLWVGALVGLSLSPSVQDGLLNIRLGAQAAYRQLTQQIPALSQPPVQIVTIDQESLTRGNVSGNKYNPLDRRYLAQVLEKSAVPGAVIGIDYLMDRPIPEDDPIFVQAVRNAVQRDSWLIFATSRDQKSDRELVLQIPEISPYWSLSANIDVTLGFLELPAVDPKCPGQCPFSYLLGLVKTLKETKETAVWGAPELNSQSDLSYLLFSAAQEKTGTSTVDRLTDTNSLLGLPPIVDYSIPPGQVYESIPAWQVLESGLPPTEGQPIVIIAPGGYEESNDTQPLPIATQFWRQQLEKQKLAVEGITGGEIHAYMVHHWLTNHKVIPIPDLWGVALAIFMGKGLLLMANSSKAKSWAILGVGGGVMSYGLIGLQIFVGAGVLFPWLLPSMTLAGYGWRTVRQRQTQYRG